MPAGFLPTIAALNTLKANLQALQVTLNNAQSAAFKTVALFDMSNLATALQELFVAGDRACFIVHDQERFVSERIARELRVRQERDVSLLIVDRAIANRQTALFGDGVNVVGVLNIKDAILNSVVGLLQPGIYCKPVHGEQLVLEKKVRDELQGRVAFTLDLCLVGGNVIVDLGPQPIP